MYYENYFNFPPIGTKTAKNREKKWGFRERMHEILPQLCSTNRLEGLENKYECFIDFYFFDKQTIDLDNMLKHIFDAIKQKIVEDDMQIKKLVCNVYEDQKETGFNLKINKL